MPTTGIPITSELIGFLIVVLGAIAGVWWRIEARIDASRAAATRAADDLARYKTHVAETYITKEGMREQMAQLLAGINDLKGAVSHLNERIDSIISAPPQPPPRRRQRSPP